MDAHLTTCFTFNHWSLHRQAEEIPEDQMTHIPAAGVKPPLWILGHLAYAYDGLCRLCGADSPVPAEWNDAFQYGTNPADLLADPKKAEIMEKIDEAHAAVMGALPTLPERRLKAPQPLEILKDTPFATVGDVIYHLMTTHYAFHLGQLSIWRRAMDRPPLF